MIPRIIVCAAAAFLTLTACSTPYKKTDEKEKIKMQDQNKDQAFQAFLGRLRIAVAQRDRAMLTSMMANDFGYRWDPAPAEETVFDYWDQRNLWAELEQTLQQTFVPHDQYMVVPEYRGYRAGLRLINGSWRFAYFVPVEEPGQ